MLKFDIQIKVSIKSQNVKTKKISSSKLIFLTIKNSIFQFELHPHICEVRMEILVHEKDGVIKYIKAPAGVKVELSDL